MRQFLKALKTTLFAGEKQNDSSAKSAVSTILTADEQEFLDLLTAKIDSCYTDPNLRINDLTQAFDCKRTTFYNTVKRLTGKSPVKLLAERRLAQAAKLLAESSLPVNEIALATGHRDYRYFTRAFRQQYGITPSNWRKSAKQHAKS